MSGQILILTPGPQTTVQDLGRPGWQHIGLGPAGAMDAVSAQMANLLVGNPPGAAVLEAVLQGPSLEFHGHAAAAIVGGRVAATLNGAPVPMGRAFRAAPGDRLALGPVTAGARVYLALSGGIEVPPVMGSRATSFSAATGGLEGRALRAGDMLPLGDSGNADPQARPLLALPSALWPWHLGGEDAFAEGRFPGRKPADKSGKATILRAVPGPQQDAFTRQGQTTFYTGTYTLTGQSDRMGYRFDGPAIAAKNGTDILSDGTATGSVQVAGNGLPMLLMADRQTTGGYAKIATVITADLPAAAQLRPGDAVRFQKVTVQKAQALLRGQAELLAGLPARLVPVAEAPPQSGALSFALRAEDGRALTGTVRRLE